MPKIKGTHKKEYGYFDEVSRCKISKGPEGWEVREAGADVTRAPFIISKTMSEAVRAARGEEEEE